eukprot:COSAG01_NODE_7865_length_3019_cov_6.573288_5_plen_165_part_00
MAVTQAVQGDAATQQCSSGEAAAGRWWHALDESTQDSTQGHVARTLRQDAVSARAVSAGGEESPGEHHEGRSGVPLPHTALSMDVLRAERASSLSDITLSESERAPRAPTNSKKSVWMDPTHLPLIRRASAQRPPWYGSFLSQATFYSKQACQRYSPPSKVRPP